MDRMKRNGHKNYIVPASEPATRQGVAGRAIALIIVKRPGWVEVQTVCGRKGEGPLLEMLPNGLAQAIA